MEQKKRINCKICTKIYNDTNRLPMVISCGHTFCLECLKKIKICYECKTAFNRTICLTNRESFANQKNKADYSLKFCFCGETAVGKTSLFRRLKGEDFSQASTTLGVDFAILNKKIGDENVKVLLQDTAGQQKFRSVTRQYFQNCNAYILVYDLSSDPNTNELDYWFDEIEKFATEDSMLFVVGNQKDRIKDMNPDYIKPINHQTWEKIANFNSKNCQISCKTGEGIDKLQEKIDSFISNHVKKIKEQYKNRLLSHLRQQKIKLLQLQKSKKSEGCPC